MGCRGDGRKGDGWGRKMGCRGDGWGMKMGCMVGVRGVIEEGQRLG